MSSVYTLSANFFEQLEQHDFNYLCSILFRFANSQNPYKIAVDSKSLVILKYQEITQDKFCADIIRIWIDMLANTPTKMQRYDIDLSKVTNPEDMCIELCSKINGRRILIIHSANTFYKAIDATNSIMHNGKVINIIDKDEAQFELNNNTNLNVINSIVAGNTVSNSTNNP